MTAQLRSELRKVRTTRAAAGILGVAAALTLLGVFLEGYTNGLGELAGEDQQRTLLGAGAAAGLFATIAGVMLVTAEHRYGTIRPTLFVEPRRRVVLAAKLAVGAIGGLLYGIVCIALSVAVGLAILAVRDVDPVLSGAETVAIVIGVAAAGLLGAMFGVAVGTLFRNQVGAIVAVLVYAFLVNTLVFSAVPAVGRYLPGKASDALAGQPGSDLLAPWAGAVVAIAWLVVFVAAAAIRDERSDV